MCSIFTATAGFDFGLSHRWLNRLTTQFFNSYDGLCQAAKCLRIADQVDGRVIPPDICFIAFINEPNAFLLAECLLVTQQCGICGQNKTEHNMFKIHF